MPDHLTQLTALAGEDRLRSLVPRRGIDFASNDYLSLARSERLARAAHDALARGVAVGSGGSRLLRGNDPEHAALEAEAAAFFGAPDTLFFANGYMANLAVLSALPQRGDLVVHDAAIHASAHDGMRLGRAATIGAAHNDPDAVERAIVAWRRGGGTGRAWIAVESLYSMDGDRAPLDALIAIGDRHDAMLIVDEAHATGVFGANGRGLADRFAGRDNVIALHTCGKALGCEGAFVSGPRIVRDFLINRARSFIFTTAPTPLAAAIVRESLRIVDDEPERRDRLWTNIRAAETALAACGVAPTGSQILPVMLGDAAATMRAAARVQQRGFDVRGIRPPTVPAGSSRLRISITLNATVGDIAALAEAIGEALR